MNTLLGYAESAFSAFSALLKALESCECLSRKVVAGVLFLLGLEICAFLIVLGRVEVVVYGRTGS